LKHVNRSI